MRIRVEPRGGGVRRDDGEALGVSGSASEVAAAIDAEERCQMPSDQRGNSASFHPRSAAANLNAPMACPASCWQYRNARSPYFQASRQ
jgi:hypothetical protein